MRRLGEPFRLRKLTLLRLWRRTVRHSVFLLALAAVIFGLAGPQWGREAVQTRAANRDLVVVLDVSRSMLAEQPNRLERAVRALEHLNDTVRERGEVRLGLVVGAAFPRLLLTPSRDYEHFAFLLGRIRDGDLPPELWRGEENAVSGTRLGAALTRALALLRPDQSHSFEILLVSDGHDPLEDAEWMKGVQNARERSIPVHVLAIGDPTRGHPIPRDNGSEGPLSRLNEEVLEDIARRTDGTYLPAHTLTRIPLGTLMQEIQANRRLRQAVEPDVAVLTQPSPRQTWFYVAALGLLCIWLSVQDAKPSRRPLPSVSARVIVIPMALLLVSASPLPPVDECIRQGNAAFEREEYDQALDYFQKAEGRTLDPGLVAFNTGATFFKLGRYQDAALQFERSLEDKAAPLARRRRAQYDLGTALLSQAGEKNSDALRRAAVAFRSCLQLEPLDENLRDDARHNLELAQRLWLKAIAREPGKEKEPNGSDKEAKNGKKDGKSTDTSKGETKAGKEKDKSITKGDEIAKEKIEGKDKTKTPGGRLVLPDAAKLKEYTPEQMETLLRDQVERIARDRHIDRRAAAKTLENAPNW